MSSRSKGANLLTELNVLTQLGVVGNLPDSELLGRFLAHKGRAGGDPSGSADRNGSGVIRIRGKTGDGGQSVISRRGRPREGSRLRHDDLQAEGRGRGRSGLASRWVAYSTSLARSASPAERRERYKPVSPRRRVRSRLSSWMQTASRRKARMSSGIMCTNPKEPTNPRSRIRTI